MLCMFFYNVFFQYHIIKIVLSNSFQLTTLSKKYKNKNLIYLNLIIIYEQLNNFDDDNKKCKYKIENFYILHYEKKESCNIYYIFFI